jgi:putative ABC transport system permease protein
MAAMNVAAVFIALAREVTQDVKHTLRLWTRRPWHTGFAILALAIGIGANTGVFSVVNSLLLRSLPFQSPERLAALTGSWWLPDGSAAEFHDWRQKSAFLADVALVEQKDVNLGGPGESLRAHASQCSWNFFSLLGTQTVVGRGFAPGEDTPGRNEVAVIGYGLWQQLFGGERRALGSTIRMDGMPLTIIGIAPPGFEYPRNTVIWKAAAFSPGNKGWDAIARLRAGETWPQAREAFTAEFGRLTPSFKIETMKRPPRIIALQDELAGPAKSASIMLMAGVVLILLIACINVANLLIARTADRATEFSIRAAMGASRARLSQQLLTECLLLSLAATFAGLIVAFWTTSIAAKLQPAPLASQAYSILDGRVLGFAIAVSILSGLLFGVFPSLFGSRVNTFEARGSSAAPGSRLIREALAAGQIMLTIVLLAASVSVGRAFVSLVRIDRGFDLSGLITVNVSLEGTTREASDRRLPYFENALARVRRLPGVRSASATEYLPLYSTGFVGGRFGMDGLPARENSMVVPVLAEYFRTMGGHILHGREFTAAEVRADTKVAVVNERFASEFGPPADAVGREISAGKSRWKIVGVVRRMDYMVDGANSLQIFVPAHSPVFSTFVARVDGNAEDRLAMVRDAIHSVDPQVPVFGVKTMERRLDDALARPQFYTTAIFSFAAFALLLAIIGIYGIVAYAVGQRTHEMGIRMALGTTPVRLRAIVLRQGLITVAAGAVPGVFGVILGGRFLESFVEGAKSVDAATCMGSVLFVALIAAAGIWGATRSVAQLEIMEILRTE